MTTENAKKIFDNAPIIKLLAIECSSVTDGQCEASLALQPQHLQHLGIVHGGVVTTLAGHAAAGAATSLLRGDEVVVAKHIDSDFIGPASNGRLLASAHITERSGKTIKAEATVTNQNTEIARLKLEFVIKKGD